MRNRLGYQASQVDVPVGEHGGRARRFVGIRGETYYVTWHRLRLLAFLMFAASGVLRCLVSVPEGEIPIVPTSLFYLSSLTYGVALVGRLWTRRYTWVECSHLRRALSRRDVQKLSDAVAELRAGEVARRQPSRVFIVTGPNGFESEALALAQSLNLECYRRAAVGFEEVG